MPPALRTDDATIALRADGGIRLAVVADTHSAPHPRTNELLAAAAPDAILHGGDIGELEVLDQLRAIAPVYAVRGNIDTRARELPDVLNIALAQDGIARLRILLTHIAVYGPKLRAEVAAAARKASAQLVVCGHSHVPFIGSDKGLTIFNPGSIGPRRFSLPILFGTIEIAASRVKLAHISAETGQAWSPP